MMLGIEKGLRRQSRSIDKVDVLWENAGRQKRLTTIHVSSQLRATGFRPGPLWGQGSIVPTDSALLILLQGAVCPLAHH